MKYASSLLDNYHCGGGGVVVYPTFLMRLLLAPSLKRSGCSAWCLEETEGWIRVSGLSSTKR